MASAPALPELDFEAMSAEELLRWGAEEFGERLCLTCSWQKQSSVLVHMVAELGLRMDTVELDTHLFFRESYDTRDALVERYGRSSSAALITVAEQHRREGPNLGRRSALLPHPKGRAARQRLDLDPGSRHSAASSPRAARPPKLQWSDRYGVWKVNPIADWDEKRVGYIR